MRTTPVAIASLVLLLSACATESSYRDDRAYDRPYDSRPVVRCMDCGRVDSIEQVRGDRRSNGGGALIGGIVGGVLGNQVGKGDGRKAATVVGVVAGAAVGNEIEKDNNGAMSYDIRVQMEDGRRLIFNQRELDGIREGDRVQARGNRVFPIGRD